jgi:hypothetical protein
MGEGRLSEFENADDIVPIEGFVLIEDLVERHPVGEILEQNFDRNARPPENATAARHFRIGSDEIVQCRAFVPMVGHVGA